MDGVGFIAREKNLELVAENLIAASSGRDCQTRGTKSGLAANFILVTHQPSGPKNAQKLQRIYQKQS